MEQRNLLGPHSESEGEGLGALGMEVGLKRGPHQPPKTWERALRREGRGWGAPAVSSLPGSQGNRKRGLSGHQLRVEGGVALEAAEEEQG